MDEIRNFVSMDTAEFTIETLQLSPHEEGGWYRRTFESSHRMDLDAGERSGSSSILYLLKKDEFSRLHYLASDEIWYFHKGNPIELHSFHKGSYSRQMIGNSCLRSEVPQLLISAGTVFGAFPCGDYEYSLVSCSVTPGFVYEDFFWPDIDELLRDFPANAELIRKLA